MTPVLTKGNIRPLKHKEDAMSAIRDRMSEEIKTAMKAKDTLRLGALRMIKAEIMKKETASGAGDLDENGMIALLQTMKKQRLDSIAQFEKGGREDLAQKERDEMVVIESFLPKQLGDEELSALVAATASELGVSDMKGMGPLIKAVKDKAAGGADGKRISMAVKAHLSS